jgi:hypothetical protein
MMHQIKPQADGQPIELMVAHGAFQQNARGFFAVYQNIIRPFQTDHSTLPDKFAHCAFQRQTGDKSNLPRFHRVKGLWQI